MRSILVKTISIIFILIVIDKVFGFFFDNYIFKKTISGERGGSLNYLLQRQKKIDYVIFGSSRAKHQINPEVLSNIDGKGFNAGINGLGGPIYCSVAMELILKAGIKPKALIFQLDSKHFLKSHIHEPIKEISILYPFLSESVFLREYVEQSGWKEKVLSNSDIYKFNSKFYYLFFNYLKRNQVKDNNGFVPLIGYLDTSMIVKSVPREPMLEDFSDIRLKALENIINICHNNNIALYIVLPPNFREITNDEGFYNNKLKTFIYKKSRVVRIIDMSDIKAFNDLRNPENWKDEGHLNEAGANKFSHYLNDSLSVH